LGMAGTQSSGLTGARFGAMCKRMQHGFAARNGLPAAFLATAGYTGIKKVFEPQHGGFLSVFGEANSPDLSLISAGLGERWEIEQIITKSYAVMGGILGCESGWRRHGSAVFAHAGRKRGRVDSDSKINGGHETLFDEGGPTAQGNVRVTAHFRDGARLDSFVFAPKAVTAPVSEDRVVTKFHNLTRGIVEPGRQRAIIRAVLDLEGLRSISELINLVTPVVGGAFDEHPLLSQGEQI
jgi:aconitate decarboxylase